MTTRKGQALGLSAPHITTGSSPLYRPKEPQDTTDIDLRRTSISIQKYRPTGDKSFLPRDFVHPAPDGPLNAAALHPLPSKPAPNTPLLIKYIPAISKTFTLRTVSDSDIPTLTKWQNSPRVAYFWKETGDENHQRAYVRKIWDTPHSVPCIGEIDDVPFAYFEIYWAAYDLLGGYYRANPYDRGAHALVGDEAFRGIAVHWMSAIMGYLLTDHPLTTRVVMEPRSDNGVIIGLLCNIGCRYMGTVKLPHKVSALLMTTRAWFWETQRQRAAELEESVGRFRPRGRL